MLTDIVTRLQVSAPTLTDVQVAESIDKLQDGTAPSSGTVFVCPFREVASPNALITGGFRQMVMIQALTALFIRYHDDSKGAERAALFDSLKADVERALAGWDLFDTGNPFELVGWEVTGLKNNTSVCVGTWQAGRYLTGA